MGRLSDAARSFRAGFADGYLGDDVRPDRPRTDEDGPSVGAVWQDIWRDAVRQVLRADRPGGRLPVENEPAFTYGVALAWFGIGSQPLYALALPSAGAAGPVQPALALLDVAGGLATVAANRRLGHGHKAAVWLLDGAAAGTILARGVLAATGRPLGWQRGGVLSPLGQMRVRFVVVAPVVGLAVALPALAGSAVGLTTSGGTRWSRLRGDVRAVAPLLAMLAARHMGSTWNDVQRDVEGEIVTEERTKLAREMHDIVAHELSVVALQAAGAEAVLGVDPDRAGRALADIQAAARQGLVELRRLLSTMREPLRAGEQAAPTAPLPGIATLDEVVDGSRRAGLTIDASIDAAVAHLPAGPGLAVHRIVQESLTNALRHGGVGARVAVVVQCAPDGIDIVVEDDASGVRTALTGSGGHHGLVGMRERVALFGGRFEAGPRPAGGWRVHATLPTALRAREGGDDG